MSHPHTISYSSQTTNFHPLFGTLFKVFGASLFIGICARTAIPLPFTPVPLTMQTLSIMLVGALMGSRLGALSVLTYIVEGCLGLPVWSGGKAGFLMMTGPLAGYVLGFVIQAYLTGFFIERLSASNPLKILAVLLVSCILQMSIGMLWLGPFVGWDHVFILGFLPFIPGEVLKSLVVTSYLRTCSKSSIG